MAALFTDWLRLVSISQNALGREVPGNEIKLREYNKSRIADDLRPRTFPVLRAARILFLLRVCFESRVNIWLSKHHIFLSL